MKHSSRDGFTLVEVLVVIAIIAIMAGLLFPFIGRAREKAEQGRCVGSLRNTYAAARLWSADNDGYLVPAFIRRDGVTEQWPKLLVKYFGEDSNTNQEKWACPAYDKDEGTAWDWGYAINETPGFHGPSTTSQEKRNTRITIENDELQGVSAYLKWMNITDQSQRVMFCEAEQWHVSGNNNNYADFAVYDRHGTGKNNSIFFDGHIELLTPKGIETSILDPENFTNQETAVN